MVLNVFKGVQSRPMVLEVVKGVLSRPVVECAALALCRP
jgi:hypothetical protein